MKHALNDPSATSLPAQPANGLTAGLDWAKDDHVVCVVDGAGAVRDRFTIEHTASALAALVRRLTKLGCSEIAIERPDGPVVDALLNGELTVVVISPNQLKNLRSRYGSAGNKDDRFDAYVLADTLRTDRRRLRALVPDTAATITLRAVCRARKDLVRRRLLVRRRHGRGRRQRRARDCPPAMTARMPARRTRVRHMDRASRRACHRPPRRREGTDRWNPTLDRSTPRPGNASVPPRPPRYRTCVTSSRRRPGSNAARTLTTGVAVARAQLTQAEEPPV